MAVAILIHPLSVIFLDYSNFARLLAEQLSKKLHIFKILFYWGTARSPKET